MIKALGNLIFAKPIKEDNKRDNVFVSDRLVDPPSRGKVVAIGPKAKGFFNVGDTIVFSRKNKSYAEIDGEEYAVLQCDKIIGRVK